MYKQVTHKLANVQNVRKQVKKSYLLFGAVMVNLDSSLNYKIHLLYKISREISTPANLT